MVATNIAEILRNERISIESSSPKVFTQDKLTIPAIDLPRITEENTIANPRPQNLRLRIKGTIEMPGTKAGALPIDRKNNGYETGIDTQKKNNNERRTSVHPEFIQINWYPILSTMIAKEK